MKKLEKISPIQRIAALRKTGVTLLPNLDKAERKTLLFVENEPAISAQRNQYKLAV